MASRARHRKYQTENTREKIKVSYYINRLHQFIAGEKDSQGMIPDLSQGQIKAIQILLDKSLPSLSSVDQTVEQVQERTEDQMMDELREMIAKNPSLKDILRPQ